MLKTEMCFLVGTLADLQQWAAALLVLQAIVRRVSAPVDCNDHPTRIIHTGTFAWIFQFGNAVFQPHEMDKNTK